jgi:hypothetical protein
MRPSCGTAGACRDRKNDAEVWTVGGGSWMVVSATTIHYDDPPSTI